MVPYEPPRAARPAREVARGGVLLLLHAFILALLVYAITTYGLGFFVVGWYAWVVIAALALVEFTLILQRNRFGVGGDWVAPTYKPLSRVLGRRFVLHLADIASIEFIGIRDGNAEPSRGFAPYVQTVIQLKTGEVIRFPSHSSRRSLRRQVGTEEEVRKALDALEQFANTHGLLIESS